MIKKRPNILWICTDQQRFDTIAALGNPKVNTPALDWLVKNGTAFTRAYCQYPICTPSRASFLTGRYPSSVHVNFNGNDYFPKEGEETLITRLLAKSGYDCGLVGKLHLSGCEKRREERPDDGYRYFEWSHSPRHRWKDEEHDYAAWIKEQGHDPAQVLKFRHNNKYRVMEPSENDDNVSPNLHHTTWNRIKSIEFLAKASSPWLLSMNTFEPHPPYSPSWEYYRRYDPDSLSGPYFTEADIPHQNMLDSSGVKFHTKSESPDEFDAKKIQAAYYAMIEMLDHQFGLVLDHLKDTAQLDDTLIIFTSDHGEMLGDHGLLGKGCRFYEGLVRVPLIFYWKGKIKEGLVSNALVELIDIVPTILDAVGINIPEKVQGKSLMPILTGVKSPDHHKSYVRSEYYDSLDPKKPVHATMYFDGKYKIINYHGADIGELYDITNDPWEFNDLWDDPRYINIRMQLSERSFSASVAAMDPGPPMTMEY